MERLQIPIYKATVSKIDDSGIFAMSFVDYPANENNFVALKTAPVVKMKTDRAKQILTGVVLVPDQLIYRFDEHFGEYYLTFSAEDIEKISAKMMEKGIALSSTTHQHAHKLQKNHLVEIWTVTDSKRDKSVALGLGELPVGTLLASYKINDNSYWQKEVLTGKVRGFSLEGIFNFKQIKMSKPTIKPGAANRKPTSFMAKVMKALLEETEQQADAVAEEAKKDETDSGDPFLIFELAEGGEVWVDADGYCTLDGTDAMPPGEHPLADGNVIAIDDNSVLIQTQPEAEGAPPAEAAAELRKKAIANGKAFLKKNGGADKTEIAKLKAKIAELEKKPSTGKVNAKKEDAAGEVDLSSAHARTAAILRARRIQSGK